jgi:hypothetical protein
MSFELVVAELPEIERAKGSGAGGDQHNGQGNNDFA